MAYAKLNDVAYTELRTGLIETKGSLLQTYLLKMTRETGTFLEYMGMKPLLTGIKGDPIPLHEGKLTQDEYKHLPPTVEKELYGKWDAFTPALACHTSLWGKATLDHIRAGKIESYYLASNTRGECGLKRIDKALAGDNKKAIDDVVRTILRQMGGLPEARGIRSVYADCPFARAWWRVHIVNEVCDATGDDAKKIHKLLNQSQTIWERLILLTVSRNSVLGDSNIRSALISELANSQYKITGDHITDLTRLIGRQQALRELGILKISELKTMMQKDFFPRVFGK